MNIRQFRFTTLKSTALAKPFPYQEKVFTPRTDDGHAPPLSLSGKTFSLTFILLSLLVRCLALNRIKPQLVASITRK